MCLALPGKVIEVIDENGLTMGRIDYNGTVQKACLEYVPGVQPGQYVLVHAGFAIQIVDETEAKKTLELWDQIVKESAREGTDPFGRPLDNKPNANTGGEA